MGTLKTMLLEPAKTFRGRSTTRITGDSGTCLSRRRHETRGAGTPYTGGIHTSHKPQTHVHKHQTCRWTAAARLSRDQHTAIMHTHTHSE
eukprot:4576399-Prymnesium_polylepis.1